MSNPGDLTVVSHEQDGRVLSGVGIDASDLQQTMERHAPVEEPAKPAEPAATETKPAAPVEEKKPRGAKRFDELTKEREDAKREAEAARKEAADLKARLEALEQAKPAQTPAPQPVAQQPAQAEPAKAPDLPAELKSYDAYLAGHPDADYETYRDAREDWRIQNIAAPQFDARIRRSIEADQASRSFVDLVVQTRTKAREVYPDFDAVITNGPGAQVVMAPDRLDAIIRHPQSGHLQYVIAKDAALAQKLASCSPFDFGAELVRLTPSTSVALSASTGSAGSATPPPPMQPVGSGSKTTITPSAELAKGGYDFDKSGYREKRAAERGVTRRR